MRDRLPVVEPLQRALYLRSVPLFRGLRAEQLVAFARLMRERWVRRGTVLCAQGEVAGAVHFLVEGRLRIERDRRLVRVAEAPASIGLVELLAQAPSAVTAVAATNVLALVIDGAALVDVIEDHFSIFSEMRRAMGEQVLTLRGARDLDSIRRPPVVRELGPPSAHRLGLVERLIWLSRSPVLRDLGVGVLAVLTRDEDELLLREGQVLWAEGAPADFLVLLVSGCVGCGAGRRGRLFEPAPGPSSGSMRRSPGSRTSAQRWRGPPWSPFASACSPCSTSPRTTRKSRRASSLTVPGCSSSCAAPWRPRPSQRPEVSRVRLRTRIALAVLLSVALVPPPPRSRAARRQPAGAARPDPAPHGVRRLRRRFGQGRRRRRDGIEESRDRLPRRLPHAREVEDGAARRRRMGQLAAPRGRRLRRPAALPRPRRLRGAAGDDALPAARVARAFARHPAPNLPARAASSAPSRRGWRT